MHTMPRESIFLGHWVSEPHSLIQVYKDGKKVSEHVASETGTAALPKVAHCMNFLLSCLVHTWLIDMHPDRQCCADPQVREMLQLALM